MAFTRRNMLAATGAAAAMSLTRTALGDWEPNARYPDPAIQILDPAFAKYRIAQASVERLATGMRWVALADLPGEALPNVMRKVLVHAGALSG